MKLIEILLSTVGISFDTFAIMTCKGAMLYRINKSKLIGIGLIFGGWQALVLLLSNYILVHYQDNLIGLGILLEILAVLIFFGLGIYMIGKALKNKIVHERREEDFPIKEIIILAIVTSIDALLAGIGLSFLKINLSESLIPIIVINILLVILGIYTGYFYGYEQKTKAYTVGGVMLVSIGLRVLFKNILYVI
ncbi:MAG: hypothetical protein GX080_05495 [Tissierellia bacterium]|nr:hypothetical protein [Tissierellia bacterium]